MKPTTPPLSKIERLRTSYVDMFRGLENRKKRNATKEAGHKLNPADLHKYWVAFRPEGHQTVRILTLNHGQYGRDCCKMFLNVAQDRCDYLFFYQVDSFTGEVLVYDPTK